MDLAHLNGSDIRVAAGPAAARRLSFLVAVLLGVELLHELYSGVPSVGSAESKPISAPRTRPSRGRCCSCPGCSACWSSQCCSCSRIATRASGSCAVGCWPWRPRPLRPLRPRACPSWPARIAVSWAASGCGSRCRRRPWSSPGFDARARVMARWALLGTIGDLAAPAMMAGLAALALGALPDKGLAASQSRHTIFRRLRDFCQSSFRGVRWRCSIGGERRLHPPNGNIVPAIGGSRHRSGDRNG
jgi:hypothetical protein